MGLIHINKIKAGMVLNEEVRDINGRLLLGEDKRIEPGHIRIFKIWGVTEVNIRGNDGTKNESDCDVDPEKIEEIKANTRSLFRYVDLEHPAMKEIYRISVVYRSMRQFSEKETRIPSGEMESTENHIQNNFLQKLTQQNIVLPEIPSIVFELNEVIANPLSSAEDIAQVVHRSPSLTALLLKIVNSPFYGFPSKIDKISLAVTLIGTREISGLALGSRILAAQKNIPQTEQLFVSGLLHDLGRLILYSHFPEESHNILSRARSTERLLYLEENDYLGCNHTHVVRHLLQQWKLPMVLENNVFYHHQPGEAQQPVPATIVHLADIITNGLGIGTSGERFIPPLDNEAWDSLRLSPTCFDTVVRQATHQFQALESMMEI
jgi:HD-like signal output (HDOD) protein